VNGKVFQGQKKSIREAKYAAAKAVLSSFMQLQNAPETKNPVVLLDKLRPRQKFECVSDRGEPDARFTVSVSVNSETFEGTGEFLHLKDERLL
jgi:dsRNA-specific ribonuclease